MGRIRDRMRPIAVHSEIDEIDNKLITLPGWDGY